MYDLSRFKQLVALADFGSFRRAAESLGISHSALSQTITKLELHYKTPLFTRKYRSIAFTEAGNCLVQSARSIIRDLEMAEGQVNAIATGVFTGALNIGVDPTISSIALHGYVAKMITAFPHINLSVLETRWTEINDLLLSCHIDVYIGPMPDEPSDDLAYSRISCPIVVLLCRADHPCLNGDRHGLNILQQFPLIGPNFPDRILKMISNGMGLDFSEWHVKVQFSVIERPSLVREMVLASDSIGLVFDSGGDMATESTCELSRVDLSAFDPAYIVACSKRISNRPTIDRFFAIATQA